MEGGDYLIVSPDDEPNGKPTNEIPTKKNIFFDPPMSSQRRKNGDRAQSDIAYRGRRFPLTSLETIHQLPPPSTQITCTLTVEMSKSIYLLSTLGNQSLSTRKHRGAAAALDQLAACLSFLGLPRQICLIP
eukprot:scaffold30437_cov45-Attheya_sp.AAC.2